MQLKSEAVWTQPNRVSSIWAGRWGNGSVWWQTSGMALASCQRHSQPFWSWSSVSRGSPPKSQPAHLPTVFLSQALTLQFEIHGLVLKLSADIQRDHWNNTVALGLVQLCLPTGQVIGRAQLDPWMPACNHNTTPENWTLCSFFMGKNNKVESSGSHWMVIYSIFTGFCRGDDV